MSRGYSTQALMSSARMEECGLPSGALVCRYGKWYGYSLMVCAVVCGLFVLLRWVLSGDMGVASVFGIIGAMCLLLLPSVLSYRCHVDKMSLGPPSSTGCSTGRWLRC